MIKILYIITQTELGGAQRYVFDLATNLDKSQYDVHIIHGGINHGIFNGLESQNLTIHNLKHLIRPISPIHDFKAYFELKQLISNIKPDIVHLNSSKVGVLGSMAAKAAGVPKIIYTAHGFVFNEPMNQLKRWIYARAELSNAKRVDRIICVSEFDRRSGITAGISKDKLITIHNGIDPNIKFLSKEEARTALAKIPNFQSLSRACPEYARGISPRDSKLPIIGCIANFYRTKGLDILIQAMTKVDAQLVLIGDGAEKQNLQLETCNLKLENKILFAGSIPNASKYLKAFDLFVLPSRKEGLSYTLLEACAAHIPIVATNVGGTPEIILDRVNGYLARPDDPDDLADKINQAIKKPLPTNLETDFELSAMLAKTILEYQA